MKSVFKQEDVNEVLARLEKLTSESQPAWGKMNVAQMLAHCNVTYEMAYTDKHSKAGGFKKFLLNLFVKNAVVNEKSYPKNSRTAPQFLMTSEKEFEKEKKRLFDYINKTKELGENYFEGKESVSFGVLSVQEWNNSFYKHLDHHFNQFGV